MSANSAATLKLGNLELNLRSFNRIFFSETSPTFFSQAFSKSSRFLNRNRTFQNKSFFK